MQTFKYILFFLIAAAACIFTGCGSSSPDEPDPTPPLQRHTRTVLVYMAANNNLSSYATADINEMIAGASGIPAGSRLLVFRHHTDGTQRLIEIRPDGTTVDVADYDDSLSSLTVDRMSRVISDSEAYGNTDSFGLVLWSHATGWLSDTGVIEEKSTVKPRSFGFDNNGRVRMKLSSLAKALSGRKYVFIYFDCCHMATVEVAYELRNLTPQIAACPTELGLDGMPYHTNIPYLFAPSPKLDDAIKSTFDTYKNTGIGCAITLIQTTGLDNLAAATLEIHRRCAEPANYSRVSYVRPSVVPTGMYDMYDYYKAMAESAEPALFSQWKNAFRSVVADFHTTPSVYYELDATKFHGLACQLATPTYPFDSFGYTDTSWYRDAIAPSKP